MNRPRKKKNEIAVEKSLRWVGEKTDLIPLQLSKLFSPLEIKLK